MKPIPQHEAEKLKRENRELKKRLQALANASTIVCQAIDSTADGKKFDPDVGKRIASLVNFLELETDGALHFGLHLDFKKIEALKKAALRWAVSNIP
jgi:hypothetical protein